MTKQNDPQSSRSKIVSLLEQYDLQDLGDELVEYWTRDSVERMSLRELEDHVNKKLLAKALQEAQNSSLEGEVENYYRLLTADDVSPGTTTEARRRLERVGVDVNQLTDDFVSRQAIYTYLTKVRGVSNQPSDDDPVENAETYLRSLKQRTSTITHSRLTQLRDANHLSIGSPRILVDIQVLCEDCGQQYSLADLFAAGSCACDASGDP